MRLRNLMRYWLAVMAGGMLAFLLPGVGFAPGIGALPYFVYAIPCWLLCAALSQHRPALRRPASRRPASRRPALRRPASRRPASRRPGVATRAFAVRLAAAAAIVPIASLLLGWRVLACPGAAVFFYCGELGVRERMAAPS